MMKKYIFLLLIFIINYQGYTQDIHFSQFYNSPLILNPALTGNSNCLLRLGGNYRSQWFSVTVPYKTYSFFIDAKLDPQFLGRDWVGIGGYFYKDVSGDGNLNYTDASFSFSYNKPLSKRKTIIMSIGAALNYDSKSIQLQNLYFGNQWNGTSFNTGSPHESFVTNKVQHFDLDVGLLFHGIAKKGFSYHIGAVINHILNPQEHFTGYYSRVGWKIVGHAGINADISRKIEITPKVYYSFQDGAMEIMGGLNFLYTPGYYSKLIFGVWYRYNNDIIPTLGFEIAKFQLMFSYDFTISKFSPIDNVSGGLEISLIKTFWCKGQSFFKHRKGGKTNCPKF